MFRELEESLETAPKEHKVRIALAAFNLYAQQPFHNYVFTANELAEYQLINKLSAQGQLELVQALIEQIRWG